MQDARILLSAGYSTLPEHFFARLAPTPVAAPKLIRFNESLAEELGLSTEGLDAAALAEIFAGNRLPPGAQPIAMAYAGHQFGHFVPQLGDGRALLLGEVRDRHGVLRDIQLKGSGRTPYSRGGDGRAALGPVLREYVVSEAMHALGIPATRALAAVITGETVYREAALPGAILTRVAASHVRVGSFQFFAARGDDAATRRLADYVIARHYPAAAAAAQPYVALLEAVVERQAALIAAWMLVGFIHGVMNTDNMAVSGETIDFGPCAFMDAYDPARVFSSIDSQGRYAFANQPNAGQWNLARFAETLLPMLGDEGDEGEAAIARATEVLSGFPARFTAHWHRGMRAKLGLEREEDADAGLIQGLLDAMENLQADYTQTFRGLCDGVVPAGAEQWQLQWHARLAREARSPAARALAMRAVNPAYIPRNHRIEQVIVAASERADFAPFAELLEVLASPFEERARHAAYADAPRPEERVLRTFCGT
jgi:uncharacterized protein YdiU (UPF0061 family)